MPYFLIPCATRADYLWAYDIALTFPSTLHPQSSVMWWNATPLVAIICRDTGAGGMYRIPASGVSNLESRSNLCGPASSLLSFPFSGIPLEACLIYIASSASWHVLTTGEGLSEGLGFRDCCLCPFGTTPTTVHTHLLLLNVLAFRFLLRNKILSSTQSNYKPIWFTGATTAHALYLSPISREQQLYHAVLRPCIEYLWVTGLRNSV